MLALVLDIEVECVSANNDISVALGVLNPQKVTLYSDDLPLAHFVDLASKQTHKEVF